jgi:hypothetical protein
LYVFFFFFAYCQPTPCNVPFFFTFLIKNS